MNFPSHFYRGAEAARNGDPEWHGRFLYRGEALDHWKAGYLLEKSRNLGWFFEPLARKI